jgi:Zn-dependent peptidase ImmA (M78 family)
MRRGFKAEAERLAAELREQLDCADDEPIPLDRLAQSLDIEIIPADELVDRTRLERLNELQPDAFSAATFRLPNGRRAVVYNPLHSDGRTRSNQAHELAHVLLDHALRMIERVGSFQFVTCDPEQEQEAEWLAGSMLLPRAVLLGAARDGLGPLEIAEQYGTSEAMARFRLNASGVLVQVGRESARGSRRRS